MHFGIHIKWDSVDGNSKSIAVVIKNIAIQYNTWNNSFVSDEEDDEDRHGVSSNVNKNNFLFYTSDYSDNEDEYNASVGSKKKYPKLDIPQYDVLIRQKSWRKI